MLYNRLKVKIQKWYFIQYASKTDKVKLTGWLWGRGGFGGWDSFVLKYGGEVFLERSIFCMINISFL
jgi:hypothetical protein